MASDEVPGEWWKAACEAIRVPLACVGLDHRFTWTNEAYETLTGYSSAEMRHLTWMDITIETDVGGDMASATKVIRGEIPQYTTAKRYRHKLGYEVPIQLTAWRFPRTTTTGLLCFIVQAHPTPQTERYLKQELMEIEQRLKGLEKEHGNVNVNIGNRSGGDNVGRDKTTNSTAAVKYILAGVIALAVAMTWLAYYYSPNHGKQAPHHTHEVEDNG